MDSAITQVALAAATGGAFQIVSEVFKIGQGLISSLRDAAIANNEQMRANTEQANAHANDAAARGKGAGWLTSVIALIVFVSAFILTFIYGVLGGWVDLPTSIVTEQPSWSILWGLFDSGSSVEVTEVKGWVHGPEFWPTVRMAGAFIFGVKAVSTGRRFF